ncbi:MAG TPA: tetratricopeptide repeat protein [Gemmatimonadota bacterium]|jgi:tetratricopeptide (TPR) repeat protein
MSRAAAARPARGWRAALAAAPTLVWIALAGACAEPAEDHLSKGNRFLADGKTDDAVAEFRVALRDSGQPPPELLWKLGLLSLDAKNLTDGRSELSRLVQRDPSSRERVAAAYLLFAARWFKAGDPFSAIQALEAARAVDPGRNLGPFYYEMGDYYFELPDYERAAQSYLLALALSPGVDPDAIYRLALAQERLGRWPQALKQFRAYAAAAPAGAPTRELRYHLGESAFRSAETAFLAHRYGEALDFLRGVLETGQPENRLDDAYYLLGEVRYRSGDAAGAEAAFEKVLELAPSSSSRLYGEAERRLLDIRIGGPT